MPTVAARRRTAASPASCGQVGRHGTAQAAAGPASASVRVRASSGALGVFGPRSSRLSLRTGARDLEDKSARDLETRGAGEVGERSPARASARTQRAGDGLMSARATRPRERWGRLTAEGAAAKIDRMVAVLRLDWSASRRRRCPRSGL
jgi:hypothetical protein